MISSGFCLKELYIRVNMSKLINNIRINYENMKSNLIERKTEFAGRNSRKGKVRIIIAIKL